MRSHPDLLKDSMVGAFDGVGKLFHEDRNTIRGKLHDPHQTVRITYDINDIMHRTRL